MKNHGLKGHFDIIKRNKNGDIVQQVSFDNLILDSGLKLLGLDKKNGFGVMDHCHLGVGNSEPHTSQVSLDNWLAHKSSTHSNTKWLLDTDEKSVSFTYKAVFEENQAVGNISEIGMSPTGDKEQSLFSRALIKDNNGRATVITKLPDEILEVYYTLKVVISHQDVTGVGKINQEDYKYIIRPAYLGNRYDDWEFYSGEIGDITSYPSNKITYKKGVSVYDGNTHKKRFSCTLNPNQAVGNIRSVFFPALFNICWQCQFNRLSDEQAIVKTDQETLTLNFDVSWGRA